MIKIITQILQFLFGSNKNEEKIVSPQEENTQQLNNQKESAQETLPEDLIPHEESLEDEGFLDADQDDILVSEKEPKPIVRAASIVNYFLSEGEYFKGPTKKEWIFLHHTLGWHDPFAVIDSWDKDNRGRVGTEYIIGGQSIKGNTDFDGKLLKAIPDGGWAWHLGIGRNKLHSNSIGIELNCFGPLTKGGYKKDGEWIQKNKESFYSYTGTEVISEQVCELRAEFRGYKYWHDYSDKQIIVLKNLLIKLQDKHGINLSKGLRNLIYEKGAMEAFDFFDKNYVTKHKGLWAHSNVKSYKSDAYPNPKLIDMILSF